MKKKNEPQYLIISIYFIDFYFSINSTINFKIIFISLYSDVMIINNMFRANFVMI